LRNAACEALPNENFNPRKRYVHHSSYKQAKPESDSADSNSPNSAIDPYHAVWGRSPEDHQFLLFANTSNAVSRTVNRSPHPAHVAAVD